MRGRAWTMFCAAMLAAACSDSPSTANPKVPAWAEVAPGATYDSETGLPSSVVHKATGIVLALVPAGQYLRSDWEGSTTTVTIPAPFYLAIYETTESQWVSVMKKFPYLMEEVPGSSRGRGKNYPVRDVYWDEVEAFLKRTGFRLPTEIEWEYACQTGRRPEHSIDEVAWHYDNAGFRFMPVGQKRPNKFGLYDMLGNVCEWCSDLYVEDRFPDESTRPEEKGHWRVLRGGSINCSPGLMTPPDERRGCRTDPSSMMDGGYSQNFQGLRVCRDP